jgi:hypothetical protein
MTANGVTTHNIIILTAVGTSSRKIYIWLRVKLGFQMNGWDYNGQVLWYTSEYHVTS